MITIKTDQEIKIMRQGGQILKKVMADLLPQVVPGVTTNTLNQKAEALIKKNQAQPSFKTVGDYQWATCLPINDQIVHTSPSSRILKDGDLLTIDIGVYYRSYHTDYAVSLVVGKGETKPVLRFLDAGRQALEQAIVQACPGHRIGDISQTIYQNIHEAGYYVIKNLTGHGIGKNLHEEPLIPGYLDRPLTQTVKLTEGMTIAIEVIYAMGTSQMQHEKGDKWSLATRDGSLAACFEKTIAVTQNKAFILT